MAQIQQNLPRRGENCIEIGELLKNFGGKNANVNGPARFVNGLLILREHGGGEQSWRAELARFGEHAARVPRNFSELWNPNVKC